MPLKPPLAAAPKPNRRAVLLGLASGPAMLSACTGVSVEQSSPAPRAPQEGGAAGSGQVRVGLILPMSGSGNAARAAESMRNAAEMALAEFTNPNVQLLIKDDGGSPAGAQAATQTALEEGAEIILGPLFAQAVSAAGGVARARSVPLIAFSTDATVASRGVYLLSFLPESDVDRVVAYAASQGKRSFAALVPENPYGNVVEAEFKSIVPRRGGRIVAFERYPLDRLRMQDPIKRVAQSAAQADAMFIPDGADAVPVVTQGLAAAGVNLKRAQLLGTGLWDDPRIFNDASLHGAWYAAPDGTGFRAFAGRYRQRYNAEPVRTATLAYDAVSLVAALVKTQGAQRFSDTILTNGSGFSGIDGIFRFKADGTNERGLAVMRVTSGGGEVVSAAPRSFGSAT